MALIYDKNYYLLIDTDIFLRLYRRGLIRFVHLQWKMVAKVFLIGCTGIKVTMTNDKATLVVVFVMSREKSI